MSTGRLEMQTLLRLTHRKGKHPGFALFPAFWAAANADSRQPGAPPEGYPAGISPSVIQSKQGKLRLGFKDERVKTEHEEDEEKGRIMDEFQVWGFRV